MTPSKNRTRPQPTVEAPPSENGRRRRPPERGVAARVLQYLSERPGSTVWITELAGTLNIEQRQVAQAVYYLATTKSQPIETVMNGNAWTYAPNKAQTKPSRPLFEQIGVTKDGVLVLEDESGTLYRATEM